MALAYRLLVGLGNPTAQYEQTRHNAGFWLVDELAKREGFRFSADARSQSLVAQTDWGGEKLFVVKPMAYMNRSGVAVAAIANFYKFAPEQILVVHDELDFLPGVAKLKLGGGHGGHNGLRDIAGRLGNTGFARIRLGIGHPGQRDEVVNYVLNRPSAGDRSLIHEAIGRAVDCLPDILEGKLEKAMNALH